MARLLTITALVLLASCDRPALTEPTPLGRATAGAGSIAVFSLDGWVSDTAGRLLEGATVEVLSGPNAGAIAITDAAGQYAFSQPFAAVPSVRATKDGYVPGDSNVFILNGTSVIRGWFRLGSPQPPVDLSGHYTLTFTADPSCQSLPGDARTRTYQTTIAAASGVLTLEAARFAAAAGRYASNVVYFSVFEDFLRLDFSDPPVWELLDAGTSVYIDGFAEGTVSGPVAELRVDGEIEYCGVTEGDRCEEEVACESHNHRLVLARR
jgi:hypothetical protein